MRRLNVGCADIQPEGWVNADPDPRWGAPYAWDPATQMPWPGAPELFDLIVANHVLQMVDWDRLVRWLDGTRKALKDGGVLRLLVPDAEAAFEAWQRGEAGWYPIADAHETSVDGKFCMYVTQAGATRSIFTEAWLHELLARAGFYSSTRLEMGESTMPADHGPCDLDSRAGESLIVEARR